MSYQKEWGKLILTEKGMLDFFDFLSKNKISLINNKVNKNISVDSNKVFWLSEGDNSVTLDHEIEDNKLFWTWITQEYVFKETEVFIINLIDQTLEKEPIQPEEVRISTIIFNSQNSEEIRYITIDLYTDNSYIISE